MKNKLSVILRIAVSFGLLGGLFWFMRGQIRGVWGTVTSSNLKIIGIALVFTMANVVLFAYRMKTIFAGEELNMSLGRSLQLTFLGFFFNNFMPTAVGGDLVKAHYAACINKKKAKSYASVFMDRFIGLYTFLVIAATALIISGGRLHIPGTKALVFVLLAGGIIGVVVAVNKAVARYLEKFFMKIKMLRLGEKLHAVYKIVHDYRNRGTIVVKSFLISLLAQCFYFSAVYLFFRALGGEVNFINIFLIMPVVAFISMVPSVGGLGVREGAMVVFFSPLVGREIAFTVSLLLLSVLFVSSLVGGVIHLWWGIRGIMGTEPGN